MMNSNPQLTPRVIRLENCQVLFENRNVEKNSPPAVSDQSEVSTVSSDESLCADFLQKPSVPACSVNDSATNPRKRTVSEGGDERPFRLLAQPLEDKSALPPLHTYIRQQIEVFTVEQADMDQRAPGRKNPIRLHQVGLRCIHCRHLPQRAKRAVCFPTSVARVYHAVSDMKFDHFSRCAGLPESVRAKLHQLREGQKSYKKHEKKKKKTAGKSSFTSTAQYYHDAALLMGMIDRDGGVYMKNHLSPLKQEDQENSLTALTLALQNSLPRAEPPRKRAKIGSLTTPTLCDSTVSKMLLQYQMSPKPLFVNERPRMLQALSPTVQSRLIFDEDKRRITQVKLPYLSPKKIDVPQVNTRVSLQSPQTSPATGVILLSSPRDEQYLNEIHCFIRKQVEVFAADASDVNAPAPGRRQRIILGQVGIRCIHCAALPAQQRLKRAVCYPPSMKGIYHAVSNMKFDHFTVCQSLPTNVKARFEQLYSSEKPQNTRVRTIKGARASPMGQFYVESALSLGLVDTETGIRFRSPRPKVSKLPDMTGMSALLFAATDPTIRDVYFQSKSNRTIEKAHT
ncbi:hypothetical protein FisN_10Hh170 [Fistulifera solaris]|uniref:Uncharacterized protein n=1 Tax=Fistulifera solaris TaxID=1519565 RepID=A0A1Z5JXM2_FISSO|nr:hypothetical protein FisN_10Hh170 [Fistulifera solaris]|eukprot:GAX18622.1 hypothetical protein FisN_10Hh170 [Fistulifera solaris]